MKALLFIISLLLCSCDGFDDNLFSLSPTHPLNMFYKKLKEKEIAQKLHDELAQKGLEAAIELCKKVVPEIPEHLTRYFLSNKEFCNIYTKTLY